MKCEPECGHTGCIIGRLANKVMDLEKECARLKAKDVKDKAKIRDAALEEAASAIVHFSCGCYKVIRKLKAKP